MNDIISKACDFIIKTVQESSNPDMSGFQYCVDYSLVSKHIEIELTEDLINNISDGLFAREEVADVIFEDEFGFDVVLYTAYAPNYIPELWNNY